MRAAVVVLGVIVGCTATPVNPVPNKIHPAAGLTTELNSSTNGRLFQLTTTDGVSMKVCVSLCGRDTVCVTLSLSSVL